MLRADVNVAVVTSAPPLSVTVFAALPRLSSALTLRLPAVIVTPPVNVFAPDRSSVPGAVQRQPPAAAQHPRQRQRRRRARAERAAGERDSSGRAERRRRHQRAAVQRQPARRRAQIGVGADAEGPGLDDGPALVRVRAGHHQRAGAVLDQVPDPAERPR